MQDFRYAFRVLTKRPGFTAVAILTIALGVGANTAIFTVVNAVLLRPLPFSNPGRLVLLVERTTQFPTATTSWQNYGDWRDQSHSFEAVAAFRNLTVTLTGGAEPERVGAKMATASLLPMLGVSPVLGRGFTADEDRPGAAGVVLISDGLWHRRFGASAAAIGQSVTIDEAPCTIVGVLPATFQLMQPADIVLPMGPWTVTLPDDRGWHPGIWALARLKPHVSLTQAQAEMQVIADRLARQYPETNQGVSATVTPLHDYIVRNVRQSLVVLVAAVGFVLLIACANVTNLLLARAVGRQKEIAIRTALGAARSRVVRQLLIESVLLSLAGGATGLLIAYWSVPMLAALSAGGAPTSIALDSAALAFTFVVSAATGVLFGLVPALQTSRIDVSATVNEGGRANVSSAGHHRLRRLLVVAEMALATMLLVGAGLLVKSLSRLQDVSAGIDPANLLVADAPLSPVTYAASPARNAMIVRLLGRLRTMPGVRLAEVATAPPFSGAGSVIHFNVIGRPPKGPEEFVIAGYRAVSGGYFAALGVPLHAGRFFTERDRDESPPVAIVNDTFVRRFLRDQDPLDARVQLGALPDEEEPKMQVVGVVGDTKQAFEADVEPTIYAPYMQRPLDILAGLYRNVSIVLKTNGDPAATAPMLRAAVHEVDPNQPLVRVRTMETAMADSVAQPRLRTVLLAIFTAVALLLALIGVYGVMAYFVSERTHEIGVRIALGASPSEVRALVVGQGIRLAAGGVVMGTICAVAGSRALRSLLFGVSATDPATFTMAAIALVLAAVAATFGPAHRASRVDPVRLLR